MQHNTIVKNGLEALAGKHGHDSPAKASSPVTSAGLTALAGKTSAGLTALAGKTSAGLEALAGKYRHDS